MQRSVPQSRASRQRRLKVTSPPCGPKATAASRPTTTDGERLLLRHPARRPLQRQRPAPVRYCRRRKTFSPSWALWRSRCKCCAWFVEANARRQHFLVRATSAGEELLRIQRSIQSIASRQLPRYARFHAVWLNSVASGWLNHVLWHAECIPSLPSNTARLERRRLPAAAALPGDPDVPHPRTAAPRYGATISRYGQLRVGTHRRASLGIPRRAK